MSNDIAKKAYLGSVIVPPRYEIDDTPTEGSTNLVTSGGVYAALGEAKERFVAHVDFMELISTGTATADAAAAQIYAAAQGGKDVVLALTANGAEIYAMPMVITPDGAAFLFISAGLTIFIIDSTGNVTHETISLVSQGTAPEPLVVTTSRYAPSQGEAYDQASSTAAEIIAALEAGRPVYVESIGAITRYTPVTWTTAINNVAQVACVAVNAGTREMSLELKQLKQCYIVDDHISFSSVDLTKIHDAPLIVTVTESDGSYASDKTYAEIAAAHEAGRVVEARYTPTSGNSLIYRLARIDPSAEQAYFTVIDPTTSTVYIARQIGIPASGSIVVTQARLTTQS